MSQPVLAHTREAFRREVERARKAEAEAERLRAGWDADVDWANKLLHERDVARAENERLREERHELESRVERLHDALAAEENDRDAEVERLREALQRIVDEPRIRGMRVLAREALADMGRIEGQERKGA